MGEKLWTKLALVLILLVPLCLGAAAPVANEPIYNNEQEAIKGAYGQLEQVSEPGTYPVELRYYQDGEVVVKTIRLTLTGPGTVVNGEVAIDAGDFEITVEQAAHFTVDDYRSAAGVKAWNIRTGEPVASELDVSAVVAQPGVYPVRISAGAASKVVQATVVRVMPAYFATYFPGSSSGLNTFEYWWVDKLHLLLVSMLLVPLFLMLFQYGMASRLIRDVIQNLYKRKQDNG